MSTQDWEQKFIEDGAALEHARWARWHAYMVDKQTPENLERWKRQVGTEYNELSEEEKESDRREARNYLPLIRAILDAQRAEIIAIGEGLKKENRRCYHSRNSWLVCGGYGEWCYVCGAFRGMRNVEGTNAVTPRTTWTKPTGDKENNPYDKMKNV